MVKEGSVVYLFITPSIDLPYGAGRKHVDDIVKTVPGIYTERQKKLITSSGRRSLKSTASKLIIFGHKYIWTQISLNTPE